MRKDVFALTAVCLIVFCFSCKKDQKTQAEQLKESTHILNSQKQRVSSLPVISLKVSLLSTNADNTVNYKIKSETGDDYTDGTDYVKAIVDQNGYFNFNTNTSRGLGKRFVVYDLSDPVDQTNTYNPAFARGYYNQYNYTFSTGSPSYGANPFIPLQNLQVGSSECVFLNGGIDGDGVHSTFKYNVRFHSGVEDNASSPTAFGTVTRLSDAQWKIEPGTCSSSSNDVGALWTGDTRNEIFKGFFHLPFSFLLTKK